MKFQLQENDITILQLGATETENGGDVRNVTFEINGKSFERKILLGKKEDGGNEDDPEQFYLSNKEQIQSSLIDFLSQNHLYYNQ
ncbi:hypothetical protein [Chryseobacterium sp.]|uniref:hypothetical protein n=1 Tax=Chryseobacterium sp. TaxID=1871047 RepID=UPI0011C7FCD9|nr:hypothetical protein [Chryseobacterium sp.]TXF79448.1 hypothetical protein FUA25_03420 [Chryseobacterium sp.]